MVEKKIGWRPNTRKHYYPNKPFNPFYPPDDTPDEVMRAFWGEDDDDEPLPLLSARQRERQFCHGGRRAVTQGTMWSKSYYLRNCSNNIVVAEYRHKKVRYISRLKSRLGTMM